MKMKAQAAMEYLMTYGWAILIVIIVAAALYSLGVFSSPVGTRATGFANIGSPVDWTYNNNGTFNIMVKNAIGSPITIQTVTANCGTGTPPTVTLTNTTTGLTIGAGGTKEFSGTCSSLTAGSSYSTQVSVTYTKTGGAYTQTDTGTVTGTTV